MEHIENAADELTKHFRKSVKKRIENDEELDAEISDEVFTAIEEAFFIYSDQLDGIIRELNNEVEDLGDTLREHRHGDNGEVHVPLQ